MTKREIIDALRNSESFNETHKVIYAIDDSLDWNDEERKKLMDVAITNKQVYKTLDFKDDPKVKNFYRDILKDYCGEEDDNVKRITEITSLIPNIEIAEFLELEKKKLLGFSKCKDKNWHDAEHDIEFTVCDGLYHANSVRTSLSFIKQKMMYSREFGKIYFANEQTAQWSDDSDVKDGVFNDIFFDNCDCRLWSDTASAYGPITFVFNEELLKDNTLNIRITKMNPAMDDANWSELPYGDKFYTTKQELENGANNSKYPFRATYSYHTTVWDKNCIMLTPGLIKYIIVERNSDLMISKKIKNILENQLKRVELDGTPVVIRDSRPSKKCCGSNTDEVLWEIPEIY